jgi:hypothetical protein
MSSNVHCRNDIFKQLKTMFHTLKWECLSQDNNIKLYRKHFELEVFEINITDKYIYFTIPFIDAQVNYSKKIPLEHFCDGLQFLQYHIDNYVKTIINNICLYEDNSSNSDITNIQISYMNNHSNQYIVCSS